MAILRFRSFLCLKEDHRIRDCKRKKGCFYCKGLHNSTICSERDKKDDQNKEDSPSRTTTTQQPAMCKTN